ncbi:MAG: T9SS type A sorting domain-containing protein [Bacteroidales bacterium]|nr:T9SS type A sorting domain-containing protein [Bacteroidales bacterium]
MKKVYILMTLLFAGVMAEAQSSVWDGSRKLWTHGEGTESNPYLIESAENLAFLAYMVDKGFETRGLHFRLTTDLDLNGSEDQPWIPIGLYDRGFDEDGCDRGSLNDMGMSPNTVFRGHFDGGNHVISNLYVDGGYRYAGLFGYADGWEELAVIENVFVVNGYVKGINCGGIVGHGTQLVVSHCRNAATVEGTTSAGGIVGQGAKKINNCSNAGALSGSDVGGIVGGVSGAELSECFNTGDLMASRKGGGILCVSQKASVENCYNTGRVSADGTVADYYPAAGGLVGMAATRFEARNCYNVGEVTGNHHVGCLIGYVPVAENVSIDYCYYLDDCSGSVYGTAKSAEEMRSDAFVTMLNQEGSVWVKDENHVNDGFPILTRTDLAVNDYEENCVMLYPNPTRNVVKIIGMDVAEVQVYNALGQMVKTAHGTSAISMEGLPQGVYLLRARDTDGKMQQARVVKQ